MSTYQPKESIATAWATRAIPPMRTCCQPMAEREASAARDVSSSGPGRTGFVDITTVPPRPMARMSSSSPRIMLRAKLPIAVREISTNSARSDRPLSSSSAHWLSA